MKKIISFLVVLFLISYCLSACIAWDPILRYAGGHGELIATAIHSIPGVESSADDSLIVLEEDPYGRVLFAVCLTRTFLIADSWDNCIAAIMIMQKCDGENVYFYPERNYHLIVLKSCTDWTENNVNDLFTDDIIDNLKDANLWNIPPTEEDNQLIIMPNIREKNNRLSNAAREILKQHVGSNIRCSFFRKDSTGNHIYFVLHVVAPSTYEWYIAAFKQDSTLCNGEESIIKLDKSDPDSIPASIQDLLSGISLNEFGQGEGSPVALICAPNNRTL